MNATELIMRHADVDKLLEHYDFDKVRNDGDTFLRSCCKIHGGDNPSAFVINRESGLWYCHTGDCGGGDLFTLVQLMENIEFTEAVKWLADFYGVDVTNATIVERKDSYLHEMKKWIEFMKERARKKERKPFTISSEIHPVTSYRAFNLGTLEHFGLGFVKQVELTKRDGSPYTLSNRLVFPIMQDNIQVGLSFRKTKASDYPKWSHQPVHLEVGKLLYNYDEARGKDVVAVVEGITDVWAYYEIGIPAVATFGAHLSIDQYRMLLRLGSDIVLSYDGDDAGRGATKKALDMLRYKANVYVVSFEDGEDPASVSREQLKLKYESREKVL